MRNLLAILGASTHTLAWLVLSAAVVGPTLSAARGDIRSEPSAFADHLTPEGLVSICGALTLLAVGRFSPEEAGQLPIAMYGAYDEMGPAPSLVLHELQGGGDGALWIEPSAPASDLGIVFLHGYGGNFTINCWQFAQAAPHARTVCPSLGVPARWSSKRGRQVIERSIRALKGAGARRVVLAGLSQGALGASVHARPLRHQIAGLVLVSGVSRRASVPGVPLLVVHGTRDTWTAGAPARSLARRAGPHGELAMVRGGHFVFLQQRHKVRNLIQQWLSKLPAPPRALPGQPALLGSDTTGTRG